MLPRSGPRMPSPPYGAVAIILIDMRGVITALTIAVNYLLNLIIIKFLQKSAMIT